MEMDVEADQEMDPGRRLESTSLGLNTKASASLIGEDKEGMVGRQERDDPK